MRELMELYKTPEILYKRIKTFSSRVPISLVDVYKKNNLDCYIGICEKITIDYIYHDDTLMVELIFVSLDDLNKNIHSDETKVIYKHTMPNALFIFLSSNLNIFKKIEYDTYNNICLTNLNYLLYCSDGSNIRICTFDIDKLYNLKFEEIQLLYCCNI